MVLLIILQQGTDDHKSYIKLHQLSGITTQRLCVWWRGNIKCAWVLPQLFSLVFYSFTVW